MRNKQRSSFERKHGIPEQRVVVTRPTSTKVDIEHEKGHIALKHKNIKPKNPVMYVREEIAADYYAYRNMGKPRHMIGQLRALYNDLLRGYKVRPTSKIMTIIGRELKALPSLPEGWGKDYAKLVIEYKRRNK